MNRQQTKDLTPIQIIKQRRKKIRDKNDIKSFIGRLITMISVLFILFTFVFGIKVMKDNSMFPKISPGDVMLYYRINQNYGNQEVVVFNKDKKTYVGRIIARENDTVDISTEGQIKINGSLVIENDIFYKTGIYENTITYPVKVAKNQYFILCDYRQGSKDSRSFGPISQNEIKGKVITVLRRTGI